MRFFQLAVIATMSGLFSGGARGGTEESFWRSFASSEARLFSFEKDEEALQEHFGEYWAGKIN